MNEHDGRQAARLGLGVFFATLAVLDVALQLARANGVPRTVRAGIAVTGLLMAALTAVHAWLANRPPLGELAVSRAARVYAVVYVGGVVLTGVAGGFGVAVTVAWLWGAAGVVFPWGGFR